MPLPNREDCIHACVCKYDDAMCPMDCGHFADYTPELEKARKWDKHKDALIPVEEYKNVLADAEKWRKFLAIPSCNDCPAYPECPCDETNCPAIKIENAFEGNREEKDAKML